MEYLHLWIFLITKEIYICLILVSPRKQSLKERIKCYFFIMECSSMSRNKGKRERNKEGGRATKICFQPGQHWVSSTNCSISWTVSWEFSQMTAFLRQSIKKKNIFTSSFLSLTKCDHKALNFPVLPNCAHGALQILIFHVSWSIEKPKVLCPQ